MKNSRISRACKKKLRVIALCLTGNKACRKSKYSKRQWLDSKKEFNVWLRIFSFSDRQVANTL